MLLGLLFLALQLSASSAKAKVRVRKEVRKLTSDELNMFKHGVAVMEQVPTAEGQVLFGKAYKEYNYFQVKHAVANLDPQGDQGHFGPHFGSFHRALSLEFEAALLAVVPKLKAVPYWDITLDAPGAKYWGTKHSITASKYLGDIDGDARVGWAVTNGATAYKNVGKFDIDLYGEHASIFNGTADKHLMRANAGGSHNNNTMLTRYPFSFMMNLPPFHELKDCVVTNGTKTIGFNITAEDVALCHDPAYITSIVDWTRCLESGAPMSQLKGTSKSRTLHFCPHAALGSLKPGTMISGDALDNSTSTQDWFFFWTHHNNVDRLFQIWQKKAAAQNKTMAHDDVLWNYPHSPSDYSYGWPGMFFDDVISDKHPFTFLGAGIPPNEDGYTHADVLRLTKPGINCPYTYDNMVA